MDVLASINLNSLSFTSSSSWCISCGCPRTPVPSTAPAGLRCGPAWRPPPQSTPAGCPPNRLGRDAQDFQKHDRASWGEQGGWCGTPWRGRWGLRPARRQWRSSGGVPRASCFLMPFKWYFYGAQRLPNTIHTLWWLSSESSSNLSIKSKASYSLIAADWSICLPPRLKMLSMTRGSSIR